MSSAASAHTCVTGSAGSGSTSAQRAVLLDDAHAVGGVERRAAGGLDDGAHDHALGRPRCRDRAPAHVAARDAGVDLGQLRAGCARPARPAARTRRCRRTSWRTPGRRTRRVRRRRRRRPGSDDRLGERGRDGGDPADVDAVEGGDLLGDAGGGDGQRHACRRADSAATRSRTTSRARSSSIGGALLVDQRDALAHRVEVHAERRLARTRPAGRAGAGPRARSAGVSVGDASSSPLLTVRTSTPSRPSRVRQHQGGGAASGVDDDLEAGLRQARGVDPAQQLERVGLHDTRREGQVADLAREGPPELRRGEKVRSSLRCPAGRQVGPVPVEEDRCRRLSGCPGVVRMTTPPALPRAVSSRATGTGTTSRSTTLIALDVSARDDGALEGPGGAGHVAGRGDRGALLQRAWPMRRPAGPRARG